MNRLILTSLALSAIALIAPRPASAANLVIDDSALNSTITVTASQFDRAPFVFGGTTVNGSLTFSEGTAATGPITYAFSGSFATAGPLIPPNSGIIAFAEAGGGISDILTFNYTGGGAGGVANLTGSFVSDLDPGGTLVAPPGATLVAEGTPFTFNNINITAFAISDASDTSVPEPASLALLGGALLGFGIMLRRRNRV